MRINAIQLSWFRGAADPVSLEPDSKSMVVYGANGSGKSSFVDAIEYVIRNGKIGHLTHEYSGRRQERAIPNTHKPDSEKTKLLIKFMDNSDLDVEIQQDGSRTSSGDEAVAMDTWDYRRTVLRQHEVADFINDTKGEKYSVLLPLLGLHQMEVAAENLRQLARAVENESKLRETKFELSQLNGKRLTTFGSHSDDDILKKIDDLHTKYCPDNATTDYGLPQCKELKNALEARIARLSADQKLHVALGNAARIDLKGPIHDVRATGTKLVGAMEPLIVEKLQVLKSTGAFVDKLRDENEVKCPACGQAVPVDAFQAHVRAERERLQEVISIFDRQNAAVGSLCDRVMLLKDHLGNDDVKGWRDELASVGLAENFVRLDEFNVDALRMSYSEEDLNFIESELLPLIDAAAASSNDAPLDLIQIVNDKEIVEVGEAVISGMEKDVAAARADSLVSFINSLEQSVRDEIRLRSQSVINDISADLQRMWGILHPGEPIEDVRLYLPPDTEKAIDISLKFYGVDQDSPRLTLSDGYRNSLGLCIFLAMAKREAENDRPMFLDDIVGSLDRNHRGMVRELLEKEFSRRQIVVLTHDREWYTELRHQLNEASWIFKALLPYETPDIGIRWSHKTTTFDEARSYLSGRPDVAGSEARKIMDVELPIIAEHLQIRLPYLRGDKNDMRVAHDFLERFIADGRTCFQRRTDTAYVAHNDAIDAFSEADRLLISWANRAVHTFDLVCAEATKVIDVCEKAIEFFKCPSCGKRIWFANAEGSESIQCQCGGIRWRYGRG